MASVKAEGVRLSVHQAGTIVRRIHNSSFSDHFQSYSKLVPLLLLFKEGDPDGFYYLETKPLSYEVKGAPKDAREFCSLVIVPSGQIHFLKNSSKIVTIDMAFHKSKTSGVICMPTVKDSTKAINSFVYSSFQGEKKVSYQILYAVMSKLPPPTVIITDDHKGIFKQTSYII